MIIAVLLAAVPGQHRLAAQEADDGVVPDRGNAPGRKDGTLEAGIGRAGGKQGGVMQLTLEGAMDLAPAVSRWMRRWR